MSNGKQKFKSSDKGLYFHIPFCAQICHYCDFAKTARFDDATVNGYWRALSDHLDVWLPLVQREHEGRFSSVFFGGGTPGLFTNEFVTLLAPRRPLLTDDAEISLEANPKNITRERLDTWKQAGANRLSIGVQTFDPKGLTFLTRDHDADAALQAIETAIQFMGNVNVDLIYGWPEQTEESWINDLTRAVSLGVPHLSLYSLIYEARTPIGRQAQRRRLQPMEEELQERFYQIACDVLREAGYEHEEVSNWALPGHSCRHNFLYWQGLPYLGIGVGAHSFLGSLTSLGHRHAYGPSLREFLEKRPNLQENLKKSELECQNGGWEKERDKEGWLLEYVGCGLRCEAGIDLGRAARVTGKQWQPRENVRRGLAEGLLKQQADRLYLASEEWFRETAWSLEVALSFR